MTCAPALTAISGNASNLLTNDAVLDAAARRQICTDIWQDSQWLIGLVENLLAITRIEDGRMQLRLSPQLVEKWWRKRCTMWGHTEGRNGG